MVSTGVGGVPEVLPEGMLILVDPSPDGLIEASCPTLAAVAAVLGTADSHHGWLPRVLRERRIGGRAALSC